MKDEKYYDPSTEQARLASREFWALYENMRARGIGHADIITAMMATATGLVQATTGEESLHHWLAGLTEQLMPRTDAPPPAGTVFN